MKKNILQYFTAAVFLCLMTFPAHALLYDYTTSGIMNSPGISNGAIVETSLTLFSLNNPTYSSDSYNQTWGRLFFRFNTTRLTEQPSFAIQDTTHDVLGFVYPDTSGNYFSDQLSQFDERQESPLPTNAPVPEPGTLILIGSGLGGLLLYRKKREG